MEAQQGTITGRVTNAATGQPIAAVQVGVLGTNLVAQTNANGQYSIAGVAPGSVELRGLRLGYAEMRQTTSVTAGQAARLDFQMRPVPISLSPVVTTATGDQRRVEVGNSIAQVNAAEIVQTRPVSNVGDLLTARVPGVQVLPGTQTGTGTRVRIRGTSSLSLTNNPVYIIDGIRAESSTGSSSISVGGSTIARTGDLNPEEIETIEVVRGPSASSLYGTDAANGVIVITTKRGVTGRPQWTYYTEQTAITDRNDYPDAYRAWRSGPSAATTSTPSNAVQCFLTQSASGACVQDSVSRFNLFNDPETTPYGVGYRQQHGLQVRGGSEAVRYFVHGEWEDEDGVTKVPEFERGYLASRSQSLLPEQESPNHLTKITGRANLDITLSRKADLAVSAGYISQDVRLPMSDDSGVSGIGANVFGGPGFKYNLAPNGDTLYGYRQFTPRSIYQATTTQAIERSIMGLNTNWRPKDWLAVRGNFGLDYTNRHETQLCRFANCPDVGTDRLGFKRDNRTDFFSYTAGTAASGSFPVSERILSKTTAGIGFGRIVFDRNGAQGTTLPPGATTVSAGAVPFADEASNESRTLGAFIEENLAINDRLFLTGAIRSDRNSAFGANFGTVFYPKLAASWVVSAEPFFPAPGWLNQLRLRSAYGASGVQPQNTDALPYYVQAAARTESGDVPGVVFSALGNVDLKPERSTEIELGIDGTMWDNRVSAEITYYNKSSRDALISRILPPSIGTGLTSRVENLGEVRNRGWEGLLSARLVQADAFGWDLTLNGSSNSNNLVTLGGVPTIVTSSTQRQVEGYPLYGWWSRRLIGYEDKNSDGIIVYNADAALSEIVVSDSIEYHGYSIPRHEVAFTNGFDFLQRRFRLAALIDYKGGHLQYNNTERIRCSARLNCEALLDRNASLFDQARSVAVREHPSRTVAGYFEKADFIRLRELALSFTAPEQWASRYLRGRNVTATVAARNLGILWTRYSGTDPESTFGATANAPSDFQAASPPTYLSFRLTFGF